MNDKLTILKWKKKSLERKHHEQSWDGHHRLTEDVNNELSHRRLNSQNREGSPWKQQEKMSSMRENGWEVNG